MLEFIESKLAQPRIPCIAAELIQCLRVVMPYLSEDAQGGAVFSLFEHDALQYRIVRAAGYRAKTKLRSRAIERKEVQNRFAADMPHPFASAV